jgi:DNA-binding response OmpR family regulator
MRAQRVMIVDDDASVRALLRMTLPADGFDVVEAGDGEEALALLDQSVPDLVLLDWVMPGASGEAVLRELKGRRPDVPVIVLTAEQEPRYRELADSLGADTFLTKPFSPLQLLGELERLLA